MGARVVGTILFQSQAGLFVRGACATMAKKERRPLLAEDSLGSENEEEGPEGVAEEASEQVAVDLSGVDAETSAPSSSHPEDEQVDCWDSGTPRVTHSVWSRCSTPRLSALLKGS